MVFAVYKLLLTSVVGRVNKKTFFILETGKWNYERISVDMELFCQWKFSTRWASIQFYNYYVLIIGFVVYWLNTVFWIQGLRFQLLRVSTHIMFLPLLVRETLLFFMNSVSADAFYNFWNIEDRQACDFIFWRITWLRRLKRSAFGLVFLFGEPLLEWKAFVVNSPLTWFFVITHGLMGSCNQGWDEKKCYKIYVIYKVRSTAYYYKIKDFIIKSPSRFLEGWCWCYIS